MITEKDSRQDSGLFENTISETFNQNKGFQGSNNTFGRFT